MLMELRRECDGGILALGLPFAGEYEGIRGGRPIGRAGDDGAGDNGALDPPEVAMCPLGGSPDGCPVAMQLAAEPTRDAVRSSLRNIARSSGDTDGGGALHE